MEGIKIKKSFIYQYLWCYVLLLSVIHSTVHRIRNYSVAHDSHCTAMKTSRQQQIFFWLGRKLLPNSKFPMCGYYLHHCIWEAFIGIMRIKGWEICKIASLDLWNKGNFRNEWYWSIFSKLTGIPELVTRNIHVINRKVKW